VAKPESTIWQIHPHTSAKHTILRTYLDAWFPIMSWSDRVVFLDGFAGPGRYEGGEPGSPIIALESAKTHPAKLSKELAFLFIEERKDRADRLSNEIEALKCPASFKTEVKCGEFAPTLTAILNKLAEKDLELAPTFAMIDPFGFGGIPFELMKRLLDNPSCELFVSFMVDSINRWLEHPDENIRAHIRDAFGSDGPFELTEKSTDRASALTDLYRKELRKIARFVRSFELLDKNDRVVYHLFFASKNSLGHLKMKEAMWKVDPLGEFRFSDATNPQQQVFFRSAYHDILKADLRRQFANAANILVERVEAYVIDDTAFLPKHMREVLPLLEAEGSIRIGALKRDGSTRRKKSYPNQAYITFQ
jgi:three-Cys-motif partner protein